MEGSPSGDGKAAGAFRRLATGSLELSGVEANETQLAIMEAVDAIYRADTDRLMNADLDGVLHEPRAYLGNPPPSPGEGA
jgi:hypothetical protein